MGKFVQVKSSVAEVRLPPLNVPYLAGETATLTDREYTGLSATVKNSIVVIKTVSDPVRSTSSTSPSTAADALKLAKQYVDEAIRGLATLGINAPPQMATHTEVSTGDANTLATSRSYTDAQIVLEANARTNGDTTTLNSSKSYTDSQISTLADSTGSSVASALATAEGYTDTSITSEVSRANAADTTTYNNATAYAIQRSHHTGTQTMSTISDAGGAATKNVGTSAGTVAAGDDSRITGAVQKSANLSDLPDKPTALANLGAGSAATHAAGDFALSTRTINGHPLTADVTVTASDVGAATTAALTSEASTARSAESSAQSTADSALTNANSALTQLSALPSPVAMAIVFGSR